MESDTSAATEGPGMLPGPRPNGLFAGPIDAPDRFELLGDGRRGGEGTTWRVAVGTDTVTKVDGNYNNRITTRTIRRGTAGVSGYSRPQS